jgi:hypothetical protein
MAFNKDEKWYLSEAMRLIKEATKLIEAKEKSAANNGAAKKAASPRQHLYEGGISPSR